MKKEYRLKDSDKIGLIVKKRQRIASEYFTIYYQTATELKIAVVAGKKIGNSVERNYNKRVIREIIRPYLEELKNQSVADLKAQLVDAKKELFNLRFQNATNQLDNTSRIKEVRKNIARIQTVITEKENVAE